MVGCHIQTFPAFSFFWSVSCVNTHTRAYQSQSLLLPGYVPLTFCQAVGQGLIPALPFQSFLHKEIGKWFHGRFANGDLLDDPLLLIFLKLPQGSSLILNGPGHIHRHPCSLKAVWH